ncbi:JmjC domain, hydroxylase-domain-containing protein [Armillaria luteobubalina]|uniref:JmjC domain, hydroxylase-domain-containing protein n=1 Tax=Armillaria luteobubalina TaxID=153913 RepID=A0AA39QNX6_9AGAR|nr:JmjC domain, hydroxylase-domain-containing protein [Armillaria luteobubalina]
MDEFRDLEEYMQKVECWAERSGIIKIIPRKEWSESLPRIKEEQLNNVKISSPIEQHMQGHAGLFWVENMMRRKYMSVHEWVEIDSEDQKPKTTTEKAVEKAARDAAFLKTFDPYTHWLPLGAKPSDLTDYTPEFCHLLKRRFWRSCDLDKSAWYGANSQGTLFTDETQDWNIGHLESALTRLSPSSSQGLPGVNAPYLYCIMWCTSFAWHIEDMDLFSMNASPKFWYAIPQGRVGTFKQTMRSVFHSLSATSPIPHFLRHKPYLASVTLLAQSSCRPNHCVQHAGEIFITYLLGYHAGSNLGLNCTESVNFALDSWISK